MKKYWLIFKLTLEEYFVYRLNFFLWRGRSMVSFLTLFFFWSAIYENQGVLWGYQKVQMLSYVIGIAVVRGLVMASRSTDLEIDIYTGKLNFLLSKPYSIFKYYFTRDVADKVLNIVSVFIELSVILRLLGFSSMFISNISSFFVFVVVIILAMLLFFLVNISAASLAFWTGSVWAPRWLITLVLLEFMSGAYFPIDVLPNWLAKIIYLTPFPYLIYYPIKVWLGMETIVGSFKIILILFFWLAVFLILFKKIWKNGLKVYAAYGG